jgi:hypothetical protein
MNSLQRVESRLGSWFIWPNYIVRYLFCVSPDPTSCEILCSFFYDNEISCNDLCGLFNTCNGVNSFYANKCFYELYFKWQRDRYKFHISQYYNMYLNSKCLNQQEFVLNSSVTHLVLMN